MKTIPPLTGGDFFAIMGSSNRPLLMTAIESLRTRLKGYDISQYDYDHRLDHSENRGVFLSSRINHFIGYYIEEVIPEWDSDPQARHLGVGKKIDWENSKIAVEQKKNPRADNSSSRKSNLIKLKESALEKGKIPIYAYWEDRKKNDYMKDDVRHLHGKAIFNYLGVGEKWELFLSHVEDVKMIIKQELVKKFNEHYKSSIDSTI